MPGAFYLMIQPAFEVDRCGAHDAGHGAALECLDIDDAEVHARFVALVAACGLRSLLERLVCEETPGGGRHYGYCCVEWGASTALARRRVGTTPDGRAQMVTLIETRGEGGQCVVAPTLPGVHPNHPARGYTLVRGDWTQMPLITPKARRVLWACARALNEEPQRHADRLSPPQARTPSYRARRIFLLTPKRPEEGMQVKAYALTCSPAVQQLVKGGEGLRSHQRCAPPFARCTTASCSFSHASGGTRQRRRRRSRGALPRRGAASGSGTWGRQRAGCWRMGGFARWGGIEEWRSSGLAKRVQTS